MHFIEASAQSLLSLVNEILDITHIESGVMKLLLEPLDLAAVLAETSGTVEPMARDAQLQLTVLPAPPLWVLADAQRLRQSLSNLLSNAIKYNRPQGRVEVSTSASDDEVRIAILDTGHGLGAEEITRLFQPFNRLGAASSTIEGSGLGLVITRTLVERMNGRLEVESTPGSGSCFSIILPRHAPPRVAPAAAHATLAAARPALVTVVDGGPRKVLYVEDNPVNVQLMEAMFERLPQVELHIANTGAAGLEIARAVHPDLLLLDINLPDCNGIELLASINAGNAARTPAIAVSADAMPDDIRHALDSGFDDYWTKPLDMVKKLQALSAMLATPIRL
jgi:CheY-like chemotaxis protein